MAGGRGILDANGRLLIRSDGTVDVCEECCGCNNGTLSVTVAGVDGTGCSCILSTGLGYITVTGFSADGAYAAPFVSEAIFLGVESCLYQYTSSGETTLTADTGASAGCASFPSSTSNSEFAIRVWLRKSDNQMIGVRVVYFVPNPEKRVFSWDDAASGVSLGTSVSNEGVCIDNGSAWATGGTVSAVFV